MPDVAIFVVASVLYLAATGLYHAAWIGRARRWRPAATGVLLAAAIVHGMGLAVRWALARRPPLADAFESFSFYGWMLAVGYLVLERWTRQPGLGALVVPMALVAVVVAAFLPKGIQPLAPVLQSPWLGVHVGVSSLAYATFTLAFSTAVGFLWVEGIPKRPPPPALEAQPAFARVARDAGLAPGRGGVHPDDRLVGHWGAVGAYCLGRAVGVAAPADRGAGHLDGGARDLCGR